MTLPAVSGRCACGQTFDDGHGYCTRCGFRITFSPDRQELAPSVDLGAVTDRGLRHWRNEDAVAIVRSDRMGEPVFMVVVCDGVSSSQDPDLAARLASEAAAESLVRCLRSDIGSLDREAAMVAAIQEAHGRVCAQPFRHDRRMDPPSATIVAALLVGGRATIGWLGDSRAYWVADDEAELLTHDHSWLNEVVERGELSLDEAATSPYAHAITRCLGAVHVQRRTSAVEPSVIHVELPPGARLVLCSDGFWNYVPEPHQVAQLVRKQRATTALALARELVDHAVSRGGHDNVTVAVAWLP